MNRFRAMLFSCLVCGIGCLSSVAAQDARVEDRIIESSETGRFTWTWGSGRLLGVDNATPKQMIEKLAPGVPVVGLANLPTAPHFDLVLSSRPPTQEALLRQLGEKLSVRITLRETTTEFIVVRNHATGVPKTWERSSGYQNDPEFSLGKGPFDVESGFRLIDERDGLYRASHATMLEMIEFLTVHDPRPIVNQCALREEYNFSFLFPAHDAVAVLKSFGFEVMIQQRSETVVVVEKAK
jgi:hypothetical protein